MRQGHVRLWIAVVASVCSLAPLNGSQPLSEVPFSLVEQHLIVVKGSIAGLRGLNMLIDTGTIPSVLDQRIASKLRLQTKPSEGVAFGQRGQVSTASLSGLQIGLLQPGEVPAAIGDLSYLQSGRIDAIVGLDVLARASFTVDYEKCTLSFAPSERETALAPLQIVWPFVTARLLVAGKPMQLLVDTGSRDLVLFKSRLPAELLPLPWKGDKVVYHASGSSRLRRIELSQASLGDHGWDALSGFVLDASTQGYPAGIDGILGVRALGGTRVRFDFERGELSWSK